MIEQVSENSNSNMTTLSKLQLLQHLLKTEKFLRNLGKCKLLLQMYYI